jgi:hypothetical protein
MEKKRLNYEKLIHHVEQANDHMEILLEDLERENSSTLFALDVLLRGSMKKSISSINRRWNRELIQKIRSHLINQQIRNLKLELQVESKKMRQKG